MKLVGAIQNIFLFYVSFITTTVSVSGTDELCSTMTILHENGTATNFEGVQGLVANLTGILFEYTCSSPPSETRRKLNQDEKIGDSIEVSNHGAERKLCFPDQCFGQLCQNFYDLYRGLCDAWCTGCPGWPSRSLKEEAKDVDEMQMVREEREMQVFLEEAKKLVVSQHPELNLDNQAVRPGRELFWYDLDDLIDSRVHDLTTLCNFTRIEWPENLPSLTTSIYHYVLDDGGFFSPLLWLLFLFKDDWNFLVNESLNLDECASALEMTQPLSASSVSNSPSQSSVPTTPPSVSPSY